MRAVWCAIERGRENRKEGKQRSVTFGRSCLEEGINPVVAVLDNAIAKHLRDLLESLLGLFTRLSDGTIVGSAIGDISLHLRPKEFDRLNLRTEWRCVDQRMTGIIEQLLDDCTIVVWMLIEP